MWEFPKIRGTLLGVPIMRIIGVYVGVPLILGNYHVGLGKSDLAVQGLGLRRFGV